MQWRKRFCCYCCCCSACMTTENLSSEFNYPYVLNSKRFLCHLTDITQKLCVRGNDGDKFMVRRKLNWIQNKFLHLVCQPAQTAFHRCDSSQLNHKKHMYRISIWARHLNRCVQIAWKREAIGWVFCNFELVAIRRCAMCFFMCSKTAIAQKQYWVTTDQTKQTTKAAMYASRLLQNTSFMSDGNYNYLFKLNFEWDIDAPKKLSHLLFIAFDLLGLFYIFPSRFVFY